MRDALERTGQTPPLKGKIRGPGALLSGLADKFSNAFLRGADRHREVTQVVPVGIFLSGELVRRDRECQRGD